MTCFIISLKETVVLVLFAFDYNENSEFIVLLILDINVTHLVYAHHYLTDYGLPKERSYIIIRK